MSSIQNGLTVLGITVAGPAVAEFLATHQNVLLCTLILGIGALFAYSIQRANEEDNAN